MTGDPLIDLVATHDRTPVVLEDWTPLSRCLERRISAAYWAQAGVRSFLGGEVPYKITSDGRLAEAAAELLLAALEAAGGPGESIDCLELGAGSGLFAKLFLDAVRDLCAERGLDWAGRLRLVVSDGTREMVEAIEGGPLLGAHGDRTAFAVVDAARPDEAPRPPGGFHAIFASYVLDALPAEVLRRGPHGLERLVVRTCLDRGVRLADETTLGLDAVRALAAAPDEAPAPELVELAPLLVADTRFEPGEIPLAAEAEAAAPDECGVAFVHGHAAIASLRRCAGMLAPGGFLLLSDYPAGTGSEVQPRTQRYGSSVSVGLNFRQLAREAATVPGAAWVEPDGDVHEAFLTRLVGRDLRPEVASFFRERLSRARWEADREPLLRARAAAEEGRPNAARTAYAEALRRQPRNWAVVLEAARFLAGRARDFEAALALAARGLELNPLSPALWNVRGDCLYCSGDLDGAEEAFSRARSLEPRDAETLHNLAHVSLRRRDHEGGLALVGEALACDDGAFRERLLSLQERLLRDLDRRRDRTRDRSRDRFRG